MNDESESNKGQMDEKELKKQKSKQRRAQKKQQLEEEKKGLFKSLFYQGPLDAVN